MIADFISTLAYRFTSENNLSDITWVMCQVSDKFQRAFLDFFFGKGVAKNVINFERESAESDSRPDFRIDTEDDVLYLVECKIWDGNHHFEQYVKTFKIPQENLGYITNYPLKKDGFVVKTWSEFYAFLNKQIPADEGEIWSGYLEYLKTVCGIYNFKKPMDLNGMYSLFVFYKKLDEVFAADNEHFSSFLYNSKRDTRSGGNIQGTPRDGICGKYFELKLKIPYAKTIWGWMGVYFDRENPLICIGFSNKDGWGWPAYECLYNQQDQFKCGRNFRKPYEEDNAIWFEFNKEKEFAIADLEHQISLLKRFYNEVIEYVYLAKFELCHQKK